MNAHTYEIDLMHRAIAGEAAALTVLLAHSKVHLQAYLSRKIPPGLRRTVDVDDILQEAHIRAYRHIDRFTPRGPDSFNRWISAIALRRLRNAARKHRAAKRGGGKAPLGSPTGTFESSVVTLLDLMAGSDHTPSRSAASREAVEAVQEALSRLPEEYRQAVQLVYLEGWAVSFVATTMGRSERAIHNLCFKAKSHLRELLGSRSRYLGRSE